MQSYAHTFVLNEYVQLTQGRTLNGNDAELILGNLIPDLATYQSKYQPISHDHQTIMNRQDHSPFVTGALIHILADNLTDLGVLTYSGNYHDLPRLGFTEKVSQQIFLEFPLAKHFADTFRVSIRHFVYAALEYLIRENENDFYRHLLTSSRNYIDRSGTNVYDQFVSLYPAIPQFDLEKGFERLKFVYGEGGPAVSQNKRYRLFPIARQVMRHELRKKDITLAYNFMAPADIIKNLDEHPEIEILLNEVMDFMRPDWITHLKNTAGELTKLNLENKSCFAR